MSIKGFRDNPLRHGLSARGIPHQKSFALKSEYYDKVAQGEEVKCALNSKRQLSCELFKTKPYEPGKDPYHDLDKQVRVGKKVSNLEQVKTTDISDIWVKEGGKVIIRRWNKEPLIVAVNEYPDGKGGTKRHMNVFPDNRKHKSSAGITAGKGPSI